MSHVTKGKAQQPGQGKEPNAPKHATRGQGGSQAGASTQGKQLDASQATGMQTGTPGTSSNQSQSEPQPEKQTGPQSDVQPNFEIAQAYIDIVEAYRRGGGCKPAVIAALV